MLNTAVKAARKAGYLINKAILDPTKIQIMQKEKSDYVTNIDKECETEIINILTKAYPKHEIIAEESTDKETLKSVSDNLLRWEDFHVSFVFGCEKSGLSNKELSRCTRVCAFDLDEEYPSLNISHAALLVAYFTRNTLRKAILRNNNYLHKKHRQNCSFVTIKKPACQKTLYSLERSMIQLGEQINFFQQGNREKSEIKMRRWIINNKIEEEDAKLMISFFSEIRKELN